MGDPYPVEDGACSYTHIRLANCPYEARYKSLLDLLRRYITCEKIVRAGYIQRVLRSMHNLLLSIKTYQAFPGWGVPSLKVCPCLSQDFVDRGYSLRGGEKAKRGMICSYLLT